MKKLVILVLAILVLGNITWAEIETKVDEFDKSVTISSSNLKDVEPFTLIVLNKSTKPSYSLYIYKMTDKEWWFFAGDSIELKINNEDKIYKLKSLLKTSQMKESILVTAHAIEINNEQIELLKTAKSATFRVYFSNQPAVVWKVPENILKEWQEVIKK